MRERGLKCHIPSYISATIKVAPHAGAWIEIVSDGFDRCEYCVAPHAGAWIEMRIPVYLWILRYRRSPCGSVD